jgi:hypothetical protein
MFQDAMGMPPIQDPAAGIMTEVGQFVVFFPGCSRIKKAPHPWLLCEINDFAVMPLLFSPLERLSLETRVTPFTWRLKDGLNTDEVMYPFARIEKGKYTSDAPYTCLIFMLFPRAFFRF